jgi:hypothetical protein
MIFVLKAFSNHVTEESVINKNLVLC